MFTEPGDVEEEVRQTTDEMTTISLQEFLCNDKNNSDNNRRKPVRRARTFGAADVRPTVQRRPETEHDDRKRPELHRLKSDDKPGSKPGSPKFEEKQITKKNLTQLTDIELKKFCRFFWRSDANGSGKLTLYDFNRLIQNLGLKLNKESLQQAFNIADVDNDGAISFNDFAVTYLKRDTCSLIPPQQIKGHFGKELYMSTECVFLTKSECVEVINMLGNDFDVFRFDRVLKGMMDGMEKITLIRFYSFLGMDLG